MCEVQESFLLHMVLFTLIACSCQATLASGWEQKRCGKEWKDDVPHAPAAVRKLVDIVASQRQPVKIEPEMSSKDLLECEAGPSGPGNGSELSAIISFLLKSQQDDSWRRSVDAGHRCAWLESDELCQVWKYFPLFWEQESCCNLHEESCTAATVTACISFFNT